MTEYDYMEQVLENSYDRDDYFSFDEDDEYYSNSNSKDKYDEWLD